MHLAPPILKDYTVSPEVVTDRLINIGFEIFFIRPTIAVWRRTGGAASPARRPRTATAATTPVAEVVDCQLYVYFQLFVYFFNTYRWWWRQRSLCGGHVDVAKIGRSAETATRPDCAELPIATTTTTAATAAATAAVAKLFAQ